MAPERTAEEVEQSYVTAMGHELGTTFYALYKEVVWVHAKWLEYRELFANEPEVIPLLNRTAGFFFKIVQDGLWEDVLLHISRITDRPSVRGRQNLSIGRLPELIGDPALQANLGKLLATVHEKTAFAREHRNRRIAHRDLLHAMQPDAEPLSGISRKHVEEMLTSLRELMNFIQNHYCDGMVAYDYFLATSGARGLIGALRRYEDLRGRTVPANTLLDGSRGAL